MPESSHAVPWPVPVPSSSNRPPGFDAARTASRAPTLTSDAMLKPSVRVRSGCLQRLEAADGIRIVHGVSFGASQPQTSRLARSAAHDVSRAVMDGSVGHNDLIADVDRQQVLAPCNGPEYVFRVCSMTLTVPTACE